MITRDSIRELAEHQSGQGCAVSFYFQPQTPKDQSHREEAILVKDLVKEALRNAEANGPNVCARQDLNRILDMADRIHNNGGKAKAIFADSSRGIWQEFDLPARLSETRIIVNNRFHLKPLAPVLEFTPRVCVVLIDRTKARLFDYNMGEATEMIDFFNELPRLGESDGFAGFDAGHNERHIGELSKRHYKQVCETVMKMVERGEWESVAFGCRDENWPEVESVLHTYVQDRLLGRFRIEPSVASPNAVGEGVEKLLRMRDVTRRHELLENVIGEARANGKGALGLRHVLSSLEKGEVQTMLIGDKFQAEGSECGNCGHIQFNGNGNCALCGQDTRHVDDLSDALIGAALRNGIEILYLRNHELLEKNGHVAALLRFRSDQNTPMKLAS